jgi:hypothetical protein
METNYQLQAPEDLPLGIKLSVLLEYEDQYAPDSAWMLCTRENLLPMLGIRQ